MKAFNCNFHVCEFANTSRSTRNGFAHDTTLYIGGVEVGRATCHYLNRTWERYAYQTVMTKCVNSLILPVIEIARADWMEARGYKRMSPRRRDEFAQWIEGHEPNELRTLACLWEHVQNWGLMAPPYPEWYGHRPAAFDVRRYL